MMGRGSYQIKHLVVVATIVCILSVSSLSKSLLLLQTDYDSNKAVLRHHQEPAAQSSTQTVSQLQSVDQGKVRILWGISSRTVDPQSRQRRHLIRNTYLDYDRIHRPHLPDRVCSLHDVYHLQRRNDSEEDHSRCQIIYTFLLDLPPPSSEPSSGKPGWSPPLLPSQIPPELEYHEKDVLYFPTSFNSTRRQMELQKLWGWLQYANELYNQTTTTGDAFTSHSRSKVDLVAHMDSEVLVLPSKFWNNSIFQNTENDMEPRSGVPHNEAIYAGFYMDKAGCVETKCKFLERPNGYMNRFILLSMSLIDGLFPFSHLMLSNTNLQQSELPSLGVSVANAVWRKEQDLASAKQQHGTIQEHHLQGVVRSTSAKGVVGDYLAVWDKYKDSLVNYTVKFTEDNIKQLGAAAHNHSRKPRLLLGIFTMDSELELSRRKAIRSTYLKAFHGSTTPGRLCSLLHLDIEESQEEGDCQLAYVFVMGGNQDPSAPKELITFNDSFPPTIVDPPPGVEDSRAGDIVYLNIQENMKEGKSQTWLSYALDIVSRKHYFDYIGKTDTDTLIFPKSLLNREIDVLPRFPDNGQAYGGGYRIRPSTNTLNLGPVYFGGAFYVLSPDLARFIVSPVCDRKSLAVYSEDQSIGNFIHSLGSPIHRFRMRDTATFEHPVKDPDRFRYLWKKKTGKKKG